MLFVRLQAVYGDGCLRLLSFWYCVLSAVFSSNATILNFHQENIKCLFCRNDRNDWVFGEYVSTTVTTFIPNQFVLFFLFSWCHSQSFWQHWNWNTYAYEYVCNQFSPGAISMLLLLLTATMKSILFIRYVFHLSRNTPTGCSKILFDTHHENIPYIYFAYHNNNNNRMASKFCPSHHITHKYHWYIASVNGSTESNIISCKMEDDVLHYILHPFHITQIK